MASQCMSRPKSAVVKDIDIYINIGKGDIDSYLVSMEYRRVKDR